MAPSLKLDEGNDDIIRPSASIFAVKCSKQKIYTLHRILLLKAKMSVQGKHRTSLQTHLLANNFC